MKKLLTILLLVSLPSFGEEPPLFKDPLSPRIANYEIDVKLEPEKRMIHGKQLLVWVNKSGVPIEELQFHLYLNAFRNSKTTFLKESGGSMRGEALADDGWGFTEVDRISLASGEGLDEARLQQYLSPLGDTTNNFFDESRTIPDLMSTPLLQLPLNGAEATELTDTMEFIQPDDGNEHDKTVFRVPLPEALPPGAAVALNIDFHAQLPTPPFARTGAKKEYFFVGQWFPKIGVVKDGQWNAHQFHASSEFFADYGVYDVNINVPKDHVVGATGQEVESKEEKDGTVTRWFHAEDVHDFAWTSSPDYVVFEGVSQDVHIRALMQPDHAEQGERYIKAAQDSVAFFQDNYGDYPFPNLTVVDPRRGAMGSGGMEYPTLITAGTFHNLPTGIKAVEMVIGHEFGHNYWYHLLASNEFEESWLDEGINSYTDSRFTDEYLNGSLIEFLGFKSDDVSSSRRSYLNRAGHDAVVTRAWEFYDNNSYGSASYARSELILRTLRNIVGPETMSKIMRTYVAEWRFRHPTTKDFIAVAEKVSGQDLQSFFQQALFTNRKLDYSVSRIINRTVEDKGYDIQRQVDNAWDDTGSFDPDEVDGEKDEPADSEDDDDQEDEVFHSIVKVRRIEEFQIPVEIEVVFNDGTVIREEWDGMDPWTKFEYEGTSEVLSAEVDPDRKLLLDANFTNNSRVADPLKFGQKRTQRSFTHLAQLIIDLLSF